MTALELAARAASEATGLNVDAHRIGSACWLVQVFSPIDDPDGEQPIERASFLGHVRAIAYCEGLEAGARIATERHRIECWEQARTVLRELEATK